MVARAAWAVAAVSVMERTVVVMGGAASALGGVAAPLLQPLWSLPQPCGVVLGGCVRAPLELLFLVCGPAAVVLQLLPHRQQQRPPRLPLALALVRVAPVRVALVRIAPDKSIPVIFTPVKLIEESAAPNALTPAPIIYPLRATYPTGRVAVARPVIPPEVTRVITVDAPLIFALVIFVPASETPDKSTLVSAALASDTLGPTMKPLRNTYPVGSVARGAVFTSPPVTRRIRVAPVRLAPVRLAPVRMTSVRSRDPDRFALMSETPAPRINPPRTT